MMSKWRPIETAPTAEDSRFLVGNGTVLSVIGNWEIEDPIIVHILNGEMHFDNSLSHKVIGATHWMPLPLAPEVEQCRGEDAMRTIEQIVEEVSAWGDATFPGTTIDDLVFKFAEESGELSEAALAYLGYWYLLPGPLYPVLPESARYQKLLDEIADCFIVLSRLTKALDADVRQVIEDKWDVVRARDYSSNEVDE